LSRASTVFDKTALALGVGLQRADCGRILKGEAEISKWRERD